MIPKGEIEFLIDNIGLVSEPYNYAFGDNATLGSYDGEILIAFNRKRSRSTFDYKEILRRTLSYKYPHLLFFFSLQT